MPSEASTMTIAEIAKAFGIGRSLARRLAREDAFPPPVRVIRLGRRMVVARAAVEAVLAAHSGPVA